MAGCSLAVSVVAGLMDRRRPLALLRLTGMPLRRLRATVLLEAAAPLVVTAVVSAALGVLADEVLLKSLSSVPVPPPDPWLVAVLAGGLLGAMLVVAGTLPILGRVTSTDATRFE
jgi:predicted lysophospholipase L1 biosynthesis ABC-type transport system permease subunit